VKDWQDRRDAILARVGQMPIRVLVVEGPEDRQFVESLLTTRKPGSWQSSWIVGEAGGKRPVIQILKDRPDWFGLVDKDEWTDGEVATKRTEFSGRLFIHPRFCMENFHVEPSELWSQLGEPQRSRIHGGFNSLESSILAPLDEWVRHGALWHCINPLQEGLQAIGFKTELLSVNMANQRDEVIRLKLQEWHDYLDPVRVMGEFHKNLNLAKAASTEDKLKVWVHGKRFFRNHVLGQIQILTGRQVSAEVMLANLQKGMSMPSDLQSIWGAIGLP
jgi:hypothetical protein